jgi:hypothetical protein
VSALGAKEMEVFAESFCFLGTEEEKGEPLRLEMGVFFVDVLRLDVLSSASPVSSSSSLPNESFGVPTLRFFFLITLVVVVFGVEDSWGVDALYFVN